MTWEIAFVLTLLFGAVASFIWEKLPVDVTAVGVFAILLATALALPQSALPDPAALLAVFANPAPLTVGAMFVISLALERCGFIDLLTGALKRLTKLPFPVFLAVMVLAVAGISAWVNNTPVVVVLMPVMIALARQMHLPASKVLIPLSYASIFGGVCTLIGTSTNLLVNGVMIENGLPGLGMFELASLGVPLLILSTLYLMVAAPRLLPTRESLTAILTPDERREFIAEAFVKEGSALVGKTYEESDLHRTRRLRLLEIIREGVALEAGPIAKAPLQPGDRLVLSCQARGVLLAHQHEGIDLVGAAENELEQISATEGMIVEGVVGPGSALIGRTIRQVNFRQHYRAVLLAVHRHGRNLREQLETLPLQFGDTLLLLGSDKAITNLRRGADIIMLDQAPLPAADVSRRLPWVAGGVMVMIITVSAQWLAIEAASLLLVAAFLAFGVVKSKDAYQAIEWPLLFLIYGMLALGKALDSTGAAQLVSHGILGGVQPLFPEAWQPYVVLFVLFALTSVLTEFVSNNATAVLLAPLALGLAAAMQVDPRPLLIAVCVAASASFSTPVGYQTNTYVYGAGGYRFSDFARIGVPLNILYLIASTIIIPIFWPFWPD